MPKENKYLKQVRLWVARLRYTVPSMPGHNPRSEPIVDRMLAAALLLIIMFFIGDIVYNGGVVSR